VQEEAGGGRVREDGEEADATTASRSTGSLRRRRSERGWWWRCWLSLDTGPALIFGLFVPHVAIGGFFTLTGSQQRRANTGGDPCALAGGLTP